MRRLVHLIPGLLLVGAACSSNGTTTTATPLESCFDTGGGHVSCVATPNGANTTALDVNGDGKPDTFVCVTGGKAGDDEGEGDDKAENGDGGKTGEGDKNDDNGNARDGGKAGGDHPRGPHDGGAGNDDNDKGRDGGKTDGDHPRGPHDGGATKEDGGKGKGAPRCESMGCQDMRKKAGHGDDARGNRSSHDGGQQKDDDSGQGSNHDDMICPTATPPATTPPVVRAP